MTESISPSETIVSVTFAENDEIVYSFVLLLFCVGCKMLSGADATYKLLFGFSFIQLLPKKINVLSIFVYAFKRGMGSECSY